MKQLIFVSFLSLFLMPSLAAQQETLFRNARVFGLWAGPMVELNSFDDGIQNSYGGGAGLVIDQFFIGGYGLGSSDIEDLINEENYVLDIVHGGLWLGYTHKPYKLLHPYASVRLGWGALDVDLDTPDFDTYDFDQIMVVTPEIGVELNVTSFFHVAGTVGYRYVDGISDNATVGKNDLNNFNVGLSFRLGWFGNWNKRNRNCD